MSSGHDVKGDWVHAPAPTTRPLMPPRPRLSIDFDRSSGRNARPYRQAVTCRQLPEAMPNQNTRAAFPVHLIEEKVMQTILAALLIVSVNVAHAADVKATSANAGPLYEEMAKMDAVLFDAFNRRDLEAITSVFAKDLEFYHDKGGVSNFEQNQNATRRLFEKEKTLRRQLVPGSMQVYPIKDYGAIQTGEHKFCHLEQGRDDCGTFKFLHIWKRTDTSWKLTRVVSYDH
jgi:hypothetical protein